VCETQDSKGRKLGQNERESPTHITELKKRLNCGKRQRKDQRKKKYQYLWWMMSCYILNSISG